MLERSKPTLLLYNIKGSSYEKSIALLCMKLKIRTKIISTEDYSTPLGSLVGLKDFKPLIQETSTPQMQVFTEPMLVFHGFNNMQFNNILRELRSVNIRIPLKAVLTPHNIHWSSYDLYQELVKEHQKFLELEKEKEY